MIGAAVVRFISSWSSGIEKCANSLFHASASSPGEVGMLGEQDIFYEQNTSRNARNALSTF